MSRTPVLGSTREKEAYDMRVSGVSVAEISERFKLSKQTIYSSIQRAAIKYGPIPRKRKAVKKKKIEGVRIRKKGMTESQTMEINLKELEAAPEAPKKKTPTKTTKSKKGAKKASKEPKQETHTVDSVPQVGAHIRMSKGYTDLEEYLIAASEWHKEGLKRKREYDAWVQRGENMGFAELVKVHKNYKQPEKKEISRNRELQMEI